MHLDLQLTPTLLEQTEAVAYFHLLHQQAAAVALLVGAALPQLVKTVALVAAVEITSAVAQEQRGKEITAALAQIMAVAAAAALTLLAELAPLQLAALDFHQVLMVLLPLALVVVGELPMGILVILVGLAVAGPVVFRVLLVRLIPEAVAVEASTQVQAV